MKPRRKAWIRINKFWPRSRMREGPSSSMPFSKRY
jgi:hypothetical protein